MKWIVIEDDSVVRLLIKKYAKKVDYLEFVGEYSSAVEALNEKHIIDDIDLIFLDVEMPLMTGVEFLDALKKPPLVIIISSQGKYAVNAIEYNVTDYVLKPISFPRFHKAVEKAYSRFQQNEWQSGKSDGMFIKTSPSSLVNVKYDDILWIEAMENYVTINTTTNKYTIHFTMKAIIDELPPKIFVRVHRSYIVNISNINIIEDNSIIIKTASESKSIPITQTYKEQLINNINIISRN